MNPDGPLPPYQQIANVLRAEISSGQFKAEDRLPSARELADRFKVSGMTINSAIRVLREEGRLFTTQRGTFVRAGQPTSEPPSSGYALLTRQLDLITETISDLRERLAKLEAAVRQLERPSQSQSK